MDNILIATLGESPVVITAMFRLLTEQEHVPLKKVVVLFPTGELIPFAVELIEEALRGKCEVEAVSLPFEDANTEGHSYDFLRMLAGVLNEAQKSGQGVYLSLAGGRKNMSALMALLVPLFPCVRGLYHVLEKEEGMRLLSISQIVDLSQSDRLAFLLPKTDEVTLVPIPYGSRQQVSEVFRSRLYRLTPEEVDDLWDADPEEAEAIEMYQPIVLNSPAARPLKVLLTRRAREDFDRMRWRDAPTAGRFAVCFRQMRNAFRLQGQVHGTIGGGSLVFHFYKRRRTVERPFYHTEPEGIHRFPQGRVERVIVSGLAIEREHRYKPTGEQLVQAYDPEEELVPLETVLAEAAEHVLVVPLGTTPMIATQLYALLTRQGSRIREVVLVYPALAGEVKLGADLLAQAFKAEGAGIPCVAVELPGYDDIASEAACLAFEQTLERAIAEARARHPDCQVDLALSGGRKGMAALAMFVAQRACLRFVYHTLITDAALSARVERETSVEALRPTAVNKMTRNDRLFLRAYAGAEPEGRFTLFRVPVLPARGEK